MTKKIGQKSKLKRIVVIGVHLVVVLVAVGFLSISMLDRFIANGPSDIALRVSSPDGTKTAVLVRDYAFDLNFKLYITTKEFENIPLSRTIRTSLWDHLWCSRDYPPEAADFDENIEWSEDSLFIAVSIQNEYVFGYDFDKQEKYEDEEEILDRLGDNGMELETGKDYESSANKISINNQEEVLGLTGGYIADVYNLWHISGKDNNYLFVESPQGSGGFVTAYIYNDNKLVWKAEWVYHGNVFLDLEGNIVIIQAKEGTFNCCPSGFSMSRLKYDQNTNSVSLFEIREYDIEGRSDEGFESYAPEKELQNWILENKDLEHRVDLREILDISSDMQVGP